MARPRQFDSHAALERALALFWQRGYEGTALTDLLTATGLSRSSFYNAFGSKHELFLATIEHFRATRVDRVVEALHSAPSPTAAIRQLLMMQVPSGDGGGRGCYLGKCAIDAGATDRDAAKRIAPGLDELAGALRRAIRRGQHTGEITSARNATELAALVLAGFYGIQTLANVGVDRSLLRRVVNTTLSVLQ